MDESFSYQQDVLRPLREAIARGDSKRILSVIPEPPTLLSSLFQLQPEDRDLILAGLLPALETDEDKWEIIEAAAMDTMARPEKRALVAIARHVPHSLIPDTLQLLTRISDPEIRSEVEKMLSAKGGHTGEYR